jgi:N-acetylglucosaminyldiphosphoundecaprenol N-acetyl-beta-D-mannosaminyltransferase
MRNARRQFGPISVDRLTQHHALARVQGLMRVGAGGMVLTPGADDIALAHRVPRLREAYKRVSLSLLDGQSLGWIARLSGVRLPERLAKWDFLTPLIDLAAAESWGVFLIGPCSDQTCQAVARLEAKHPGLRVVGTDASVWRGAPDQHLTRRIQDSGARLVLVALPSPKQEMWMLQHSAMLAPAITCGIGESLELLGQPAQSQVSLLSRARQSLRVARVLLQWRFGNPKVAPVRPARPPRVPTPVGTPGSRTSGSIPVVPARRSSGVTAAV